MRNLYEGILDDDSKIITGVKKDIAREWMKWATKAFQNSCKEGEDFYIDDDGGIHIIGDCSQVNITSRHVILKKLNEQVKVVELNPTSRCTVNIHDAEVAMKVLPLSQWGGNSRHNDFEVVYRTKQNLVPKDFPMLVHGSIHIEEAGNINFSIMPDCTEEFIVNTEGCGTIKWPAGFPSSAKTIRIRK